MPLVLGVSPPRMRSLITTSGKLRPTPSKMSTAGPKTSSARATAAAICSRLAPASNARLRLSRRGCVSANPCTARQARIRRTSSRMGFVISSAAVPAAGFQSNSLMHISRPFRLAASLISVPPTSMPQYAPVCACAAAAARRGTRALPGLPSARSIGQYSQIFCTAKVKGGQPAALQMRVATCTHLA